MDLGFGVTKWGLINLHLQDVPPPGTAAAHCCASIVKTSGQQFISSRLQVHTIHISKSSIRLHDCTICMFYHTAYLPEIEFLAKSGQYYKCLEVI